MYSSIRSTTTDGKVSIILLIQQAEYSLSYVYKCKPLISVDEL